LVSQLPIQEQTKPSIEPTSFANGRYKVKTLLGEGGKKKVYLSHDNTLDRDVAFSLIKTENLDEDARKRITREAQAMGKLGDHPNIVAIHDMGDHQGQPYIVLPMMSGGDIEGLIEKAPDHKLPLEQVVSIGKCVCSGLDFAHSKGIIHRDLKPGNVWMSEDGTAKIGDFGLAVVADVSRLTQEGMMVGTVSYMPPEQAMGGEVSNKADLYSLGAMLYEMVTGRPPFVGDDSVAIIGQHINTPPVSPTWHRADLPAGMESLIMLLLDKDPQKRPTSAKDVLQALESIESGKEKEPTAELQVPTEGPLYRSFFVGREQELKQLQSAFDGAISGQGALMMVVGEPGIGKTAVCEQLSTYVTLRGGKTLVGHCYEEGSLSLPYLAFVEAMRSYVLDRDVEDLIKELGSGATDVARIVSEIREKLKVEPRAAENPEEDRYRLLQAVTSFLVNAASVKPMLVILEDLHDADKGTLEMLSHVSRNLAGNRLLLVGTYRHVEVDRNHPLSASLAELRRTSNFGRVLLRGLNADEVGRMLKSITGEEVPWGLAQTVHNQTEGNPLFVQEVIRYLTEAKLLVQADGKLIASGSTPIEMSIPEGLRDVIGKRLSSLSDECNRLLSIAAVIGREFRLDVLQKVAGLPEDEVLTSIEEAKRIAIIEERSAVGASVTYRFAHAFFRTILYDENIAPRRIRLHQQVARALEEVYSNRLQEHAAELAEHFSYSTEHDDLTKAVSYGEMAAQRATDVYDYGEAARLLEQAIKVQEVLDPDDKEKRCDLLLALGDTLNMAGESRRALDVEITEAFSLAEAIGDGTRASQACMLAIIGTISSSATRAFDTPEWAQWAERADRYAEADTVTRIWADFSLGVKKRATGVRTQQPALRAEGVQLINQALELARRLDDPEAFWFMGYYRLMQRPPQATEMRWHLAEELAGWPRTGVSTKTLSMALLVIGTTFLESGQRERAEELLIELKELAQRTGQLNAVMVSLWADSKIATMDGRLEDVEAIIEQMKARGEELNAPVYTASLVAQASMQYNRFLGKFDEALQALGGQPTTAGWANCFAYLGRDAEATEILEQGVITRPDFGSVIDENHVILEIVWLDTAILLKHRQAVEMLMNRLANTGIRIDASGGGLCLPHLLGEAVALLGRLKEARSYYQEAIKICTEMRFRPGLALTRLSFAELLLDNYPDEKKETLEHLDFAINEFREMKMKPYLERALRRKEILGA